MRNAFVRALIAAAERDPRIWLLTGDLGYTVLEVFAERFPDRYVNAGVAEQNMMGLAAGLALAGAVPFVYSIANFPVMRCLEQIRNDVCYHSLPVKIVAIGGGLTYGGHGYSHHGAEDLAVLRVLPDMTVVAPGDPLEAEAATLAAAASPGPCYLRLGKAGEPVVHHAVPDFVLGRALWLAEGDEAAILTTGGVLKMAVDAVAILAAQGRSIALVSMPTLAPLDEDAIASAARTGMIVTVEEHGAGGLASAVAEVLATRALPARLVPLRLAREPVTVAGSQEFLRGLHGLSASAIVEAVQNAAARS